MTAYRGLIRSLAVLVVITVVGTVGYMVIEGWSAFDALYMTVMTMTTVGYGEVHPLSTAGRAFTLGVMLVGIGGVLYTLSSIIGFVLEGQLKEALERTRMDRRVSSLKDHFILCGYGRVGRQIAADLGRESATLVIVDINPQSLDEAKSDGLLIVDGDAGSDEVLQRAGIGRARGLIAAVDDDADNIFVTLSARALNPSLLIVARASSDETIAKLHRAGADRVVSPYAMGGRRMALLALRPLAVEFVDTILHTGNVELLLEEVEVGDESHLAGQSIEDVRTHCPGLMVLAVKRDDVLTPNPGPDLRVQPGDELLVMGTRGQLRLIESAA